MISSHGSPYIRTLLCTRFPAGRPWVDARISAHKAFNWPVVQTRSHRKHGGGRWTQQSKGLLVSLTQLFQLGEESQTYGSIGQHSGRMVYPTELCWALCCAPTSSRKPRVLICGIGKSGFLAREWICAFLVWNKALM